MDHYINILIKDNANTYENESKLLNLVYTSFHKALVKLKSDQIGVSFPDYQFKLGRRLRIHGKETHLIELINLDEIKKLDDTIYEISEVTNIPGAVKYRSISRIRTNMSKSKLQRLKKRGSITLNQERNYKAKMFSKSLTEPYLDLLSGSTGYIYRKFLHFGILVDYEVQGKFDSYGLSSTATIPWF